MFSDVFILYRSEIIKNCSIYLRLVSVAAPVGGAVTTQSSAAGGGVRCLGDSYYMSADVSQFEPHDIVVLDDGSISDTFTHKSLFPEDMDPLSVSGTLNPDGTLVVSVRRTTRFRIL
uniref:SHSP domain-containing protein n=1 Tax=Echeneis naucrates TaxID=173247 RepID=A0A665UHK1_ECHNA